ncbi:MAG: acyl-CoA dehydrogenase family protein [Burkholderiaceae bacterium]
MSALLRFPGQHGDGGPAATAEELAHALAGRLAETAVARDRQGGHAGAERELVRASGLLGFTIAREHGGQGGDWPTFFRIVRILASEDSALAHVFAFHHLQLATIGLYGSAGQARRLLGDTAAEGLFWGNAFNRLDRRTFATPAEGGWRLEGVKAYCSGALGSDQLMLTAWHEPSASFLVGALPTDAPGIAVQSDWDAFGQRQTDSGTVRFDAVFLPGEDVLLAPGAPLPLHATLRSQVSQLILANLYLGIAEGALAAARKYAGSEARPWFASGVEASVDDPYVQHRYGELTLDARAARPLADEAALHLAGALRRGNALTEAERGEVAIGVAQAKVLAHRAVMRISSEFLELTGARSTSARLGFDRFWRNARVHTLHDPVDYKLRDLGRYYLTGLHPEPTPYS